MATTTHAQTPARIYLLVSGLWLLVQGAVGLALDASFPLSQGEVEHHTHIFGVFEANGWHSLAALGLAVPSLLVALARPSWSGRVALASGAMNGVVFVAFAAWEPSLFLVASNAADQVVHAALTGVGVVTGLLARGRRSSAGQTRRRADLREVG